MKKSSLTSEFHFSGFLVKVCIVRLNLDSFYSHNLNYHLYLYVRLDEPDSNEVEKPTYGRTAPCITTALYVDKASGWRKGSMYTKESIKRTAKKSS